ncbi:PAS domain-containing protein [Hymenobacter sp. BT491]|uniref:PAS domain-containing protein n=1 Tax=Hymenobacter sp. BT491 TaxID=2766779 RepID=UPI0016534CA1|nr:PAS domain-containing protein [Hymenobacter sp. BT491]MBC6991986.1 PAS domain-containing protein [Hymenobacter sp. BT491]
MPALPDLLPVFHVLPGAYLLLSRDLVIEAASDAYLAATLSTRDGLLGKNLFEAFPDNPDAPDAHATHNLRASLAQVLATGEPHEMARQHYDVPDPAQPGRFVERHWLPRNTPVLDAQGRVSHILHGVVDVTEQVRDETTLRASQAAERTSLAEAEAQRNRLLTLIAQAPALIASLSGPSHVVELANDGFQAMFGHREIIGKTYREAAPELAGQPFFPLLDEVYRTGDTYYGIEEQAYIDRTNSGQLELLYFNFIYQATRDAAGAVTGILIFAYDVTEQVLARQQVQTLNEELAAINEELLASNEEGLAHNTELLQAQQQLYRLNEDLEARVAERTRALQLAQAEAERQRARLHSLFMHAPAAICILSGPDLVYELVNPGYQEIFPGRQLLGLPVLEALPEIKDHEVYRTFRQVYETGVTHEKLGNLIPLARPEDGVLEDRYFNYIQQARYSEQGDIDGVLVFAFEVTEQVVARQEAEKARRISEATARQLEILTDALPVLISYIDQERTYQFANQAYEAWFNTPPAELIGRPIREVLREPAYERVEAYIDRALAGERLDFDATMPYRDDFTRHIRTSYVPDIREGTVLGFYSLVADVTEQVLARQQVQTLNEELAAINEELLASNEELRANHSELVRTQQALLEAAQRRAYERETFYQVFEQTPASIALLHGPEHRFEYVNAAYQQLFPTRQLLGLPVSEALPETVEQGFLALIDTVYQAGNTFFGTELRLTVEQPDGSPPKDVYFTFTYQAYRESGTIAGISIFAYDVTEQVLARQARETERQRLHSLFMQAPAAICILDGPDLVFELVNPGYQELFPGRQLLGLPVLEALPEVAGTPVETILWDVYNTGQTHEEQALLVPIARTTDGELEERYFTFVYQARHNEEGAINGILAFVFEVSVQVEARRAAEVSAQQARALAQELGATNEQLTRTNVDLDNFIYTASHDLRAPITNIEGLLHTLQSELPPQSQAGEVSYVLELMQDSVERFKRTIEHLTDVSKLQKEHDQPVSEVRLAAVIEDVRLDLAPLLHQVGGRLDVDVRLVPTVMFPEKNLRSVVYNLLSNALKYHHPDRAPEVHVRGRVEEEYLVLEVQDNGLGVDLTRKRQLFAMFQRLHSHVEGSGVGLYMVKRMVENAGGRIEVQSQVGEGTTFSVYFKR